MESREKDNEVTINGNDLPIVARSDGDKIRHMIMENLPDFLCAVWDQDNNMIYPQNIECIRQYKNIIENPTRTEGIYYLPKTREWFERFLTIDRYNGKTCVLEFYRNITKFKELELLLQRDSVTGISNRERATLDINEYIIYALKHNEEFSVMLSDVDEFKKINDTYGHQFGDIVLANIGDLIIKNVRHGNIRANDIAGRYGGDEFFGLIKSISFEETAEWIERAQEKIREIVHKSVDGSITLTDVTMSIGMYHVSKEEIKEFKDKETPIEEIVRTIFDRCDKKLYEMKEEHHKKKKTLIKGQK